MHPIFPVNSRISYELRIVRMEQQPMLIWLTGLSGSGKTTLAMQLEQYLFQEGYMVYMLDGDNLRNGLCRDLGFTEEDRRENLRRVGEVARLMLDAGLVVICAFISPYECERQLVAQTVGSARYLEIHVSCPVGVCEERDVKGLYAKARQGTIPHFTGVSAPYEIPLHPDLTVYTHQESIGESLEKIIELVTPKLQLFISETNGSNIKMPAPKQQPV